MLVSKPSADAPSVRSILSAPINLRAGQWSLFIGIWWGLFAYVAGTDPNVQKSSAWGPIRDQFGTMTPWVIGWASVFVCGLLALFHRRFVWHVATQVGGAFFSLVWVLAIANLIRDGVPVTYGAILLWGFPVVTILLFGIRGAHPTRDP